MRHGHNRHVDRDTRKRPLDGVNVHVRTPHVYADACVDTRLGDVRRADLDRFVLIEPCSKESNHEEHFDGRFSGPLIRVSCRSELQRRKDQLHRQLQSGHWSVWKLRRQTSRTLQGGRTKSISVMRPGWWLRGLRAPYSLRPCRRKATLRVKIRAANRTLTAHSNAVETGSCSR